MKSATLQEFFSSEDKWLRNGRSYLFNNESMEKACLVGAAEIIYGLNQYSRIKEIMYEYFSKVGLELPETMFPFIHWNDNTATFEEIQAISRYVDEELSRRSG